MNHSPSQSDGMEDTLFHGYRERVRAMLRYLILERRVCPSDPVVIGFDYHLYMATAYIEFQRALDQWQGEDLVELRNSCFRGCDLQFRYDDRAATSIADDHDKGPLSPPLPLQQPQSVNHVYNQSPPPLPLHPLQQNRPLNHAYNQQKAHSQCDW